METQLHVYYFYKLLFRKRFFGGPVRWKQWEITLSFFSGQALLNYTLNDTGHGSPKFVLFLNDDWSDALEEPDCDSKLEIARAVCKCYNYQSD